MGAYGPASAGIAIGRFGIGLRVPCGHSGGRIVKPALPAEERRGRDPCAGLRASPKNYSSAGNSTDDARKSKASRAGCFISTDSSASRRSGILKNVRRRGLSSRRGPLRPGLRQRFRLRALNENLLRLVESLGSSASPSSVPTSSAGDAGFPRQRPGTGAAVCGASLTCSDRLTTTGVGREVGRTMTLALGRFLDHTWAGSDARGSRAHCGHSCGRGGGMPIAGRAEPDRERRVLKIFEGVMARSLLSGSNGRVTECEVKVGR